MPVVIARWPNGTFSVVRAPVGFSMSSLFWELDTEANPLDATLYILKSSDGWSHMTFDWDHSDLVFPNDGNEGYVKFTPKAGRLDAHSGRLCELKWPRGIVRQAYRSAFGDKKDESGEVATLSGEEIKSFPAEPSKTFSVDEIRSMPAFCGVYFAYNADGSCHYVGESKDVTSRVTKSRPEIGDRRIGVIACEPHDRKRIEAYFVAVLDPPGNAISTHRMMDRRDAPHSLHPAAATGDGKTSHKGKTPFDSGKAPYP